jgi:FMN phosphatase YigB (HAD superfamily)
VTHYLSAWLPVRAYEHMINTKTVTTILFDLGGVLVQLKGSPFRPEWLPGDHEGKEVFSYWEKSEVVRDFESGRINVDVFAERFIMENKLDIDREMFLNHLLYWPNRLFDGVPEMLDRLQDRYRLAALSNSNALHWPRMMNELKLAEMLPNAVSSHQIGIMKPNRSAFEVVLNQLNWKPEEVLFLDDLQVSVDNARSLGMQAIKVNGVEGAVSLVTEFGLLDL